MNDSKQSLETCLNWSNFVDLLRDRARKQPEKLVFRFLADGIRETEQLTYAQLDQLAQKIAAQLQTCVNPGDRALLIYPPGSAFIAAFFGCLYAGVVAIPAYPPRPNRSLIRLQTIAADAEANVALTTASLLERLQGRIAEEEDLARLKWLATDNLEENLALNWIIPAITPNTLAFLQYTSGSTGNPKGVMVNHSNLLHNSEYIKQSFELTPASVSVSWLPHFHDMGLIDAILQPLYTGFLGVLMPPIAFLGRPFQWLQAISRYRASHCGGPNFAYEFCLRQITEQQRENLDLSSWESAYNGAEPVRPETLERFAETFKSCGFQAEFFYPCYGLAETTLMVAGGKIGEKPMCCAVDSEALKQKQVVIATDSNLKSKVLVSCGRSRLDTQIAIADPDTLTRCPAHQIGEIWVAGSSVAQGYWHRPEETRQTFQAYLTDTGEGSFLRTGDLGFIYEGELFITGRMKEVLIIKGRNYYPQDIELTVAQSHPALRPEFGAAFSIEANGEERLVVVQEVEREHWRKMDDEQAIGNLCQAVMAEYDLLVYDAVLIKPGSLPKTSSGKIQRRACRTQFLEGTLERLETTVIHTSLGKNRLV